MYVAADARQSRQYFSNMYLTGFASMNETEYISLEMLIQMVNRAGLECICDLTTEEKTDLEIKTHPRCIQILAHNLVAYSR